MTNDIAPTVIYCEGIGNGKYKMEDEKHRSCQSSMNWIILFMTSIKMKHITFGHSNKHLVFMLICVVVVALLTPLLTTLNVLVKPIFQHRQDVSNLARSDNIYNPIHANLPVKLKERENKMKGMY